MKTTKHRQSEARPFKPKDFVDAARSVDSRALWLVVLSLKASLSWASARSKSQRRTHQRAPVAKANKIPRIRTMNKLEKISLYDPELLVLPSSLSRIKYPVHDNQLWVQMLQSGHIDISSDIMGSENTVMSSDLVSQRPSKQNLFQGLWMGTMRHYFLRKRRS